MFSTKLFTTGVYMLCVCRCIIIVEIGDNGVVKMSNI